MRLLLVGNYGGTNLGDEALKAYFLDTYKEHEWTVVSTKWETEPHAVPRLPTGIRMFLNPWHRTIRAIRTSDAMVFGGGAILTDSESLRSGMSWWLYLAVAWALGTPYVIAFQGIGPFRSKLLQKLVEWAVRRSSFTSVRDEFSWTRIKSVVRPGTLLQTFDPVLLYCDQRALRRTRENVLTIIPRFNTSNDFLDEAVEASADLAYERVEILLFQPQKNVEHVIAQSLCDRIGKPCVTVSIRSMDDVRTAMQRSSFVYTQRYHGAIFSLAWRIPYRCMALESGDKMDSVALAPDEQPLMRETLLRRVQEGEEALKRVLSTIEIVDA